FLTATAYHHVPPGSQPENGMSSVTADHNRERLLTMQYATTRVIAESATIDEGVLRIVQTICQTLGWDHGAVWILDAEIDRLRCFCAWHPPEAELSEFEAASRAITFGRGEGLPGRVWASGQPAWIPDVTLDPNFPRAVPAQHEGLH